MNTTHVRELIKGTHEGDGNEDVFEFLRTVNKFEKETENRVE